MHGNSLLASKQQVVIPCFAQGNSFQQVPQWRLAVLRINRVKNKENIPQIGSRMHFVPVIKYFSQVLSVSKINQA
eukprot:1046503-Ditylum_brightwellii.AAC.1